jgi:hypothetical protein
MRDRSRTERSPPFRACDGTSATPGRPRAMPAAGKARSITSEVESLLCRHGSAVGEQGRVVALLVPSTSSHVPVRTSALTRGVATLEVAARAGRLRPPAGIANVWYEPAGRRLRAGYRGRRSPHRGGASPRRAWRWATPASGPARAVGCRDARRRPARWSRRCGRRCRQGRLGATVVGSRRVRGRLLGQCPCPPPRASRHQLGACASRRRRTTHSGPGCVVACLADAAPSGLGRLDGVA